MGRSPVPSVGRLVGLRRTDRPRARRPQRNTNARPVDRELLGSITVRDVPRRILRLAYVLGLGIWIITGVVAGFLALDPRWSPGQRAVSFDVFVMCASGAIGFSVGRLRSRAKR